MSSVLHPVGPEPQQTYCARRALVLGSVLLLVILGVLVANRPGAGAAASAAPPPAAVPVTTSSASPSAQPTASVSSAASTAPKTTKPSAKKATPAKKTTPATKTTKAQPAAPTTCAPTGLRTTLTGGKRLKPKQHTIFKLSVINGTGAACVVKVSPADFSLTIYSGRDRIWTSAHCATSVRTITKKVAAEDAVQWSMAWNGRRSAKSCGTLPEIPRAGTYVATAHLVGAKPVTLRMILHA
jgi:hypothetical protein